MVVKFVASKKTCTHCAPKNRSNSIWIMVIVNLDFVHLIPRLVLLLPKFDLRACDSQIKNVGKTRRTIAFWCVMINRPTNCGTIASSGPQVSVRLALICRWARTTNNWFRGTIWSLQFYWPNGCLKGFRSCCWFHVMIIFRGNQCAYSGNSSPISRNGSTLVPTRVARRTVGCISGDTSCQNLVHSWGKISTKIFLLKLTMTSPFP